MEAFELRSPTFTEKGAAFLGITYAPLDTVDYALERRKAEYLIVHSQAKQKSHE